MSTIHKVIKDNILNIPINTLITCCYVYISSRKGSHYYMYMFEGNVVVLSYEQYCSINDSLVNIIRVSTGDFLQEGEVYYKVLIEEKIRGYYKLEDNGESSAKLFTPYRDIVYSNTNLNAPEGIVRFGTLQEAEDYIKSKQ